MKRAALFVLSLSMLVLMGSAVLVGFILTVIHWVTRMIGQG